ncbi:MAG: hypothetical protein QNJ41_26565 [Xenococcaceae cyanobacterium MO_188.B32]|nr:hypothetical protein [Xenococcaceae cyanobacterium MO_188.B32]
MREKSLKAIALIVKQVFLAIFRTLNLKLMKLDKNNLFLATD